MNAGRGTVACGVTRLVLAAALASGVAMGSAQAQEPGPGLNEVPIGTFQLGTPPHHGFSVVEPPAGVPERKRDGSEDGSGRWFFQGLETAPRRQPTAEDLYRDGLKALEAGRRDEAQRLFERLVAESPDSPRAGAARQHLGRFYSTMQTDVQASPSAQRPDGAEEALPWAGSKDAAARPASLEVTQALSRAAIYQARVSPALDGQFLSDAGDRVFFSAGSANLGTRAQGVIQAQARFLVRYPDLFAAVEGYADDGALSDAETLRLSEERAAVVRQRLIAEGVAPDRVLAYGRGREDRVSDCPAPECLAQNRRAVTVLLSRRVEARPLRRAQGGTSAPPGASPTQ